MMATFMPTKIEVKRMHLRKQKPKSIYSPTKAQQRHFSSNKGHEHENNALFEATKRN
jgi:hypothetical protein